MKTTTITVETERILIVRPAERVMGWCPPCNRQGEFILLDTSAFLDPAVAVQIQEWRKTGRLHLCEQENGSTRICLASLLCCLELDGNSGIRIAKEVL